MVARLIQSGSDGANPAVHHVTGAHDIGARISLSER
jgi:hypothetical protein